MCQTRTGQQLTQLRVS